MSLQKTFVLQSIQFELFFPMEQISKLYNLPHMPMQGDENSRQKAKKFVFVAIM